MIPESVAAVVDARSRVWDEIERDGRESDAARRALDRAIAACRRDRRSWQVPQMERRPRRPLAG